MAKSLTVTNTANTPYPDGGAVNPETNGQIMQFRVVKAVAGKDKTCDPAAKGKCQLRAQPIVRLADEVYGKGQGSGIFNQIDKVSGLKPWEPT